MSQNGYFSASHCMGKGRGYCAVAFWAVALLVISPGGTAGGQVGLGGPPPDVALPDVPGGYASTHLIVRVAHDVTPLELAPGVWTFIRIDGNDAQQRGGRNNRHNAVDPDLTAALTNWAVESIQPGLRHAPANQALARQLGLDRYFRIVVPAGTDTPAMAAQLNTFGKLIEHAETDSIGTVAHDPNIPNDPVFSAQWPLRNTGQNACSVPGQAGADISATYAWAISTGTDEHILAVIDSGVNEHVDLSGKLLTGYNAVDGSTNTHDSCDHGTHVAGIAAANTDNGVGMAGMDWHAQIVPVQVLTGCTGFESHLANGIMWATDYPVHAINMSLQYYGGSQFLQNAVQYAAAEGVILVAASGNNQGNNIAYPAKWPEVIAVGATNNQDERWSGSNYGQELSVTAPGQCVRSLSGTNTYVTKTGTSMASPHVAGLTLLIRTVNSNLDRLEIQQIIESTADDLGNPGFDIYYGHGRINAYEALLAALETACEPADLNCDGVVDGADLGILLSNWGDCDECDECISDINGDCVVDGADLGILLSNWG